MPALFLLVALIALVGIIKPLPRLYLHTRLRASVLFFVSLVLVGVTAPEREEQTTSARKEQVTQESPPIPKEVQASSITFAEVSRQFGIKSNLTELQKERAWEKYDGLCVEWTGELAHLDSGFLSGFNIGFKHNRQTILYDVLVSAPQEQEQLLLSWQQGHRYTYRATLKSPGGALMPISADWGC